MLKLRPGGDLCWQVLEAGRSQGTGDRHAPAPPPLVRGSASANSLEPRKRGGRRGTNTSWAFLCIQRSENSCSLHCVCYQNILNSREAADQEMTACLCWLVKAIIKHLLSVDPKLTERAGQLLITNAYFHTALLLSLLMVWHANEYSGSFFFFLFSSHLQSYLLC